MRVKKLGLGMVRGCRWRGWDSSPAAEVGAHGYWRYEQAAGAVLPVEVSLVRRTGRYELKKLGLEME